MKNFSYRAWFQPVGDFFVGEIAKKKFFAEEECERGLKLYKKEDLQISFAINSALPSEGFDIKGAADGAKIEGGCESGLLYGVYALLSRIGRGEPLEGWSLAQKPAVSMRVLNHWDNGDGSVERGYSGNSLFWRGGKIGYDLDRLRDYARLLASVGINQISVNNVNVRLQTAKLLTDEGLADLVKVAEVFRPFGIRLIISVHFDSPVWLGGLET